jgi:hypothetical protein
MIVRYRKKSNRFYKKNIYFNTINKDYILIFYRRVGIGGGLQLVEHDKLVTFHLHLLTKIIDIEKFPFTKLVIVKNVTPEEYDALFELLETINQEYMGQKEEGLLDYSSLLIQFAGLLSEKLNPAETVYALKKEGYFPDLMREFTQIIEKDKR